MANDDALMSQEEIERLFSQPKEPGMAPAAATATAEGAAPSPLPPPASIGGAAPPATKAAAPREPDIAAQDIEYLLSQAEKALESVNSGMAGDVPAGVSSYRLQEFSPATPSTEAATLDLVRDVELDLKIELGRTHMYLEDVLKLRKGSVVPLDKMAGDPVDIYVNGRLIARGEVLVLNDNFCVRVAELIVGANVGV
jgi:flagellar motor switch protein FliN/FliY